MRPRQTPFQIKKPKVLYSEYFLFIFAFSMMTLGYIPAISQISNMIGALMVAVYLLEMHTRNDLPPNRFFIKPLVGLIILACLMLIMLPFQWGSWVRVWTFIQIIVLMVVVLNIVRITGRTWSVEFGLGLGAFIMFIVAADQISMASEAEDRFHIVLGNDGNEGLNPNVYGTLLNMIILLYVRYIFVVFPRFKSSYKSWLYVAFGVLVCALCAYQIIFLTGSRQAQLWMLITFAGVFFIATKGKLSVGRIFSAGLISVSILALAIILLRDNPHVERLINLFYVIRGDQTYEGSFYARLSMIQVGFQMWLGSPIWGNGNEAFRVYSGFETYSHNQYIELLANYGIIGLICFYSYYYFVLREVKYYWLTRNPYLRSYAIWILVAVAGFLFSNMMMPTYYQKGVALCLAVIGGLAFHYTEFRKLNSFGAPVNNCQ